MHERVNIEAERGRLQMTKGDMCKALGVTLKTYNAYIRGAAIPSMALEKLKSMTGCSVDWGWTVHKEAAKLWQSWFTMLKMPRTGTGRRTGEFQA